MNSATEELSAFISILRTRIAPFLFVFFLVFTMSYLLLYSFGVVPSGAASPEVRAAGEVVATSTEEVLVVVPETEPEATPPTALLPVSITIDTLDRTIPVLNPVSRSIADLDAALLEGVVRHPDSADFGQDGTMFILGHSSYLPAVRNEYFRAFNGIQNLKWGDTIRVRSLDTEYVYQVDNVYEAKASEVTVPIAYTGARLTLATCDSFGSTDDRYIVEARLLYSEPINGGA